MWMLSSRMVSCFSSAVLLVGMPLDGGFVESHPFPRGLQGVEARSRCSNALMLATRFGDEAQVLRSLDSESPACIDENEQTPLHLAAQEDQRPAALALLARGALMDRDTHGRTPLHSSSISGHVSMTALLLNASAYIELRDDIERTPLHYAARGGHEDLVLLLLNRGANIDMVDSEARTALHYSSRDDGSLNVTRDLLSRGADIAQQDIIGFTALHFACYENQPLTVDFLLENGADLYSLDAQGWNPLVHAAVQGYTELVDWLVVMELQPKTFPLPDPSNFIDQDINREVLLGMPGFVLAIASVVFAFICCICPGLYWLRRFAMLHKPYVVDATDEELEHFVEQIFESVIEMNGSQQKICGEWDKVPVHTLQDLHRVKTKQ